MKLLNSALLLILTVVISMLSACGGATDAPAFNPVVSMNANISASEPLSNYTTEYLAIRAAGARGAQTAAPWSSLNTTGTTYDLTMITNPYFGLGALAGYGYTTILINIPIVAINARTMPADIATNAFNDPLVKARYHALIDQVLPYLNSSVKYISLGNEVDTYFSAPAHASEWVQYKDLIEDARTYIRQQKPNIKVGVTTTFEGATFTQKTNVASLNANMDVVILTYYPTSPSTFAPRNPLTVGGDMAAMVGIAGSKPLVMQEWGYPASTYLFSSEQMQADFITNTFLSWRQYGSGRIPFISFFKRRDWTPAHCATLSGQVAGQNFYEFLCSLGLLNNGGSPKMAYSALTTELSFIGP
jgi:hypothetical protein